MTILTQILVLKGAAFIVISFTKTSLKNGYKRGFTFQVLRGSPPLENALYLNKLRKIKFGNSFFKNFFNYYNRIIPIAIITEDLPMKSNYISLDYKNKDNSGLPGVPLIIN